MLSDLIQAAERYFERQGYVKWSDLARDFGISRQAVHQRLTNAVASGVLPAEDLERYRTVTSRRKAAQTRQETRKLRSFAASFSHENAVWLDAEAQARGVRRTDILDGLVTQARLAASRPLIHSPQHRHAGSAESSGEA
jgi:predicted transcriptional regulator